MIDSVVFQSIGVKFDELYGSILRQARNNFATFLTNFHTNLNHCSRTLKSGPLFVEGTGQNDLLAIHSFMVRCCCCFFSKRQSEAITVRIAHIQEKDYSLIVEDNKTLIEPESKRGLISLGGGTVVRNMESK